MGDQAEKVVLEAEDQVSPVVDKANAGLDSFEKKAVSAHTNVIRRSNRAASGCRPRSWRASGSHSAAGMTRCALRYAPLK